MSAATDISAARDLHDRLQAVGEQVAAQFPSSQPAPMPTSAATRLGAGLSSGRRGKRRKPNGSTGGELIYAVGDVHGRLDLLTALARQVAEDAAERPHLLVFCGDYIDRGPASAEVVEWLLCLKRRLGGSVRLLKGNHEQALLRFVHDPDSGAMWLRFGGDATLASYGVPTPHPTGSLTAARDELLSRMPAAHLWLLEGLEPLVVRHDYAFVHAGIAPDVPLREQSEDDLLWVRDEFLEAKGPFEKIIVHGHSWRDEHPVLLDHRIGVDTGAYETGALTAVGIEDEERRVVQALDEAASRRRAAAPAPAQRARLVRRPTDYTGGAFVEAAESLFSIPRLG